MPQQTSASALVTTVACGVGVLLSTECVAPADAWTPFESSEVPGYAKIPKSDQPYTSTGRVCDPLTSPKTCTLSKMASACDSKPGCEGFNTFGWLKTKIGCEWSINGSNCVYPGGTPYPEANNTDLYIRQGPAPPSDWLSEIISGSFLYTNRETQVCFNAGVGNGYVGAGIGWAGMQVAGVYYAACDTGGHRAILPSPIASIEIDVSSDDDATTAVISTTHQGLDTQRGIFYRRYELSGGAVVEQRTYAHRVRRNVMVTEFELLNTSSAGGNGEGVAIPLRTRYLFDPRVVGTDPSTPACDGSGANQTATIYDEFVWENLTQSHQGADSNTTVVLLNRGTSKRANDNGHKPQVVIATERVPATLQLTHVGDVRRFTAVIMADVTDSLSPPLPSNVTEAVIAEYAEVAAIGAGGSGNVSSSQLLAEHVYAWLNLTADRVELGGVTVSRQAWKIQTNFWSAYYALVSTLRHDRASGTPPGGLFSSGYGGLVFFDQDWYMGPGLQLLRPELSKTLAQYRLDGYLPALEYAKKFGMKGAQYPWLGGAGGNVVGCCNGGKSGLLCTEQHVTPDVSFSLLQYFRGTGDIEWLKEEAWPVVRDIARWIVSRVTPDDTNSGTYSINGVWPIDEWAGQDPDAGHQVWAHGIDNDPQMNAVSVAALEWAVEAAGIVGDSTVGATEVAGWREVANGLVIPFNSTISVSHDGVSSGDGIYVMPWEGNGIAPHTPRSYSCPEDVNYIGYPMGPILNISASQVRRDLQYFLSRTCLENRGMTATMHAVSWLKTIPANLTGAEFAMNETILGSSYGPFNGINEVDVHNNIVGGKYLSSPFTTGSGGYLQTLTFGYSGFSLANSDGMRFHRPHVPPGATDFTIRGLKYLGNSLDFWTNETHMTLQHQQQQAQETRRAAASLCLFRPPMGTGQQISVTTSGSLIDLDGFFGVPSDDNTNEENDKLFGKLGPCV